MAGSAGTCGSWRAAHPARASSPRAHPPGLGVHVEPPFGEVVHLARASPASHSEPRACSVSAASAGQRAPTTSTVSRSRARATRRRASATPTPPGGREIREHEAHAVDQRGDDGGPAGGGHPPDHREPFERDPRLARRERPERTRRVDHRHPLPRPGARGRELEAEGGDPRPGRTGDPHHAPARQRAPRHQRGERRPSSRARSWARLTGRAWRPTSSRWARAAASRLGNLAGSAPADERGSEGVGGSGRRHGPTTLPNTCSPRQPPERGHGVESRMVGAVGVEVPLTPVARAEHERCAEVASPACPSGARRDLVPARPPRGLPPPGVPRLRRVPRSAAAFAATSSPSTTTRNGIRSSCTKARP